MTISITTARMAAERLAKAKEQAHSLTQSLHDALGKATTFQDPHLSPEGLTAKRAELRTEFRNAGRVDYDKIASGVTWARQQLTEQAKTVAALPMDAAALMQAQMRWEQTRILLDSGRDFRDILKTADEVTVRAIVEYAPSWLTAQSTLPDALTKALSPGDEPTIPAAVNAVRQLAYRRLAEVTPDAEHREILTAEVAADTQTAIAQPWLDAAQRMVTGEPANLLGAAIAARVAEGEAPAGVLEAAASTVQPAYSSGPFAA